MDLLSEKLGLNFSGVVFFFFAKYGKCYSQEFCALPEINRLD